MLSTERKREVVRRVHREKCKRVISREDREDRENEKRDHHPLAIVIFRLGSRHHYVILGLTGVLTGFNSPLAET